MFLEVNPLFVSFYAGTLSLVVRIVLLLVQMLPRSVEPQVALGCQNFATKITRIAESVWKVLRLHMIACHRSSFV